ncbi:hypothetical protein EWM64_g42 [Hericium alpestre]|uniref:Clavaminate synthase-like protein n=1 Tax=Hericium alpestre TaxID=135208 RepID=A0A4Z0AA72_9AGAM|nr:hypothetical protein EWM64_g42 [Hericium alpestre]
MATAARQSVEFTREGAVTISYNILLSSPDSLTASIEKAFGSSPDSLGIIVIRDLPPSYPDLRSRLLHLAYSFAHLNETTREHYADVKSKYSFGWSHGKEIMNGKPDTLKGSYYANPVVDIPSVTSALRDSYPEYYGNNIWPKNEKGVEEFENAFRGLGSSSQTTKARLLHYFPPSAENPLPKEDEPIDSWCGFHLDHSLLTGLCSAMYLRHNPGSQPTVVGSPSPSSGLYIRSRGGDLTKVTIPTDCLAFQTGEALELATAGKLRATPHCVRVGGGEGVEAVSRETLALFMQPDVEQKISATETFGDFSKRIFSEHYNDNDVQ